METATESRPETAPVSVTASIVVHNTPASQLAEALDALSADRVGRVYVIDNSADSRLSEVVSEYPACTYRHVENRGFGAGHNIAIREAVAAGSDFHVVLNADVVWKGEVIGRLVDFALDNPDVVMTGPKVRYPDGALQYSCRLLPTPADVFAKRFLPPFMKKRRMRRYLLADIDHDRPFECSYLLGCFLFFRCSALKECGGFDERFFMYPEDIDITRRMAAHGRVLYWPGAEVTHEHAAASRHSMKMLRIHTANMIRYFNKWGWLRDPARTEANARLLASAPRTANPPAGRG